MKRLQHILPFLMAFITRTNRYKPEFEWSDSWVSNCFRAYEHVFGRRYGISIESASKPHIVNGEVVKTYYKFYTAEAFLVYCESLVRQAFKNALKFKYEPITVQGLSFAIPHNTRELQIPWISFAIALDSANNGASNGAGESGTGSVLSWSHTVTGSNPILIASIHENAVAGHTTTYTSVTYNGTTMTLAGGSRIAERVAGDKGALWLLPGAATGSHTLTTTGTTDLWEFDGTSASYSGAAQSGQPDAIATAGTTGNNSPKTMSVTTVADNCWLVMGVTNDYGGQTSASTGATIRGTTPTWLESSMFDSNGAKTPAGSYSMTVTFPTNDRTAFILVSIAPVATAVPNLIQQNIDPLNRPPNPQQPNQPFLYTPTTTAFINVSAPGASIAQNNTTVGY